MNNELQGWTNANSEWRKFHYFSKDNKRSLCGKWSNIFMTDPQMYEDSMHDHKDNCAACKKKVAKAQTMSVNIGNENETTNINSTTQ